MSQTEQSIHISHIQLKGYKSIQNLSVDLKSGLNIIIGANGSGKTNFLVFVEAVLSNRMIKLSSNYSSTFDFFNKKAYKWTKSAQNNPEMSRQLYTNALILSDKIQTREPENVVFEHQVFFPTGQNQTLVAEINPSNIRGTLENPIKVSFEIPKEIPFLDRQITLSLSETFIFEAFGALQECVNKSIATANNFQKKESIDESMLKNQITKAFDFDEKIKNDIRKYSLIQDIRLNPHFSLSQNNGNIQLAYLNYEFKIDTQWLNWSQLSDGTKRIFYLMLEVLTPEKSLCLIEEPELGIYPDQLRKLLIFLKEQAEEKQIIITTHSPQVLNILAENELDRIIFTHFEAERGTTMHHLSYFQKEIVQNFISEGFSIGDAWLYSSQFDSNTEGGQ